MRLIALLISAVLVVIDQILKIAVNNNMTPYLESGESISVIKFGNKEIFNLTYYLNDGAGWSILEGKTLLLVGFTSILIVVAIIYMLKFAEKNKLIISALSCIIGGGIGNLLDRVFRNGNVIDFIDARFIDFPIFNFADICVTVGVALFIIYIIKSEIKIKKTTSTERENTNG